MDMQRPSEGHRKGSKASQARPEKVKKCSKALFQSYTYRDKVYKKETENVN